MSEPNIKLEVADSIATVTIQRPPVNALNRAARQELIDIFDGLNGRDDVRCVVLTATGRTFCAGADIKERAGLADDAAEQIRLNRLVSTMFMSVRECAKPVIAAVNGPALGAGMCLTLCCDILMAADTAIFAMPEIDVGIAGGIKFLSPHFGPSKSRRLLLTGERVPAAELYRLGVIEECVPADKLMDTALALAAQIAAKSPLVVRLLKESFNMVENLSFRDGYRLEQNTSVEMSRSEDSKEAKRAFIEKRKPRFSGR